MNEVLKLVGVGFQSTSVYEEVRSAVLTYSTGSADLEMLLGGRIEIEESRITGGMVIYKRGIC